MNSISSYSIILFVLSFIPQLFVSPLMAQGVLVDKEEKTSVDSLYTLETIDSTKAYRTVFDDLYSSKLIYLRIEGDISKMVKKKSMGKDVDAELVWTKEDQSVEKYDVEIEARGKSRRKICSFPPIKLKFRPEGLKEKGLAHSFRTYKLVTHCFNSERGNRNLLKEYLAYKMYNQITDVSFRVQLAKIEYVDTGKKGLSTTRYGFLIEDKDELAYRHQGKMSPAYNFNYKELDKKAYCQMLVFQYMIGNQDWRVKFLHNVKLVKLFENSLYLPVPYDFDYSGLVNTSYAISNPDLPTTNHIERFFMGDSSHAPEDMKETLKLYREKKKEILAICEGEKLLRKKDRKQMRRYINTFYQAIKNDRKAAANMLPWDW